MDLLLLQLEWLLVFASLAMAIKGYYSEKSNIVKSANLRRKIGLFNGAIWLIIGAIASIAIILYF